MAPKYVVTYFTAKALGEPIRLLLSYGNVEFEDVRITFPEWPKHKNSTPIGQMPTLQIGDKIIHQSGAICRYLANEYGLAGDNNWESLEIDMVVDTIHDLRLKVSAAFYDPVEVSKEAKFKTLTAETFPTILKALEECAKVNNGHLALNKLTWADFVLTGLGDFLCHICRHDIFENNPNLKAVVDNVKALPSIKAWYEKAPKCDY